MTTDGTITYNAGAIAGYLVELDQHSKFFREELTQLQSDVKNLGAEWLGRWVDGYTTHQQMWDRSAEALQQQLDEVTRAAREALSGMQDLDRRLGNSWPQG